MSGNRTAWLDEIEKRRPLNAEESRVKRWLLINGDETLRVDYPLNNRSVAFDVGGYEGDWAADIYRRYHCGIEVFEPIELFAEKIRQRFAANSKIHVHTIGLSDKNKTSAITFDGASSSTHKASQHSQKIKLVRAQDFIGREFKKIDLIKINIEGDEYPLLNHLIDSGLIKNIENIQVQFHVFVPNAPAKRESLHKRLSRTHYLTYNYPWIWENWRLKK